MSASDDAIAFGEKLVALLGTGSFTTSYKYATLLGLLEEVLEKAGAQGSPPRSVRASDVACRVFGLYWQQARPFASGRPLRQSRQRDLVVKVAELRERLGRDGSGPLHVARARFPEDVAQTEGEVVGTVLRYPIPLLQRLGTGDGAVEDRFIYEYGWREGVSKGIVLRPDFDDRLTFVDEAANHLVALAGLIRPLVEREWAGHVARRNPEQVEELRLTDYLFGSERVALQRLAHPLLEAQEGRCFYCGRPRGPWEVDHFLARSRWADDNLDNLVVADRSCNNAKRAALAGTEALARWWNRFEAGGAADTDLWSIAAHMEWYRRPDATASVARALYLRQPAGTALWTPAGVEQLDPVAVRAALLQDPVDLQAAAEEVETIACDAPEGQRFRRCHSRVARSTSSLCSGAVSATSPVMRSR